MYIYIYISIYIYIYIFLYTYIYIYRGYIGIMEAWKLLDCILGSSTPPKTHDIPSPHHGSLDVERSQRDLPWLASTVQFSKVGS